MDCNPRPFRVDKAVTNCSLANRLIVPLLPLQQPLLFSIEMNVVFLFVVLSDTNKVEIKWCEAIQSLINFTAICRASDYFVFGALSFINAYD